MIPAYEEFIENDVQLQGICEFTVGEVEDVEIEEIKGRDKLFKDS